MDMLTGENKTIELKDVLQALKEGIPIGISVGIYGLILGVLGGQMDITWWQMLLMSIIVLAGSSQTIALPMIAANVNPFIIIATTFIVNLRHGLMSISLIPYLQDASGKMIAILSYSLTDESYAQYVGSENNKTTGYLFGAGLNVWIYWIISTILGVFIGGVVNDPVKYGFDFAFTAIFIGLLINQLKDKLIVLSAIIAMGISLIVSYLIPGQWYIIIGSILASIIVVMLEIKGDNNDK